MPLPNLPHKVDITVEQAARDETDYDVDAREPIQQAEHKTTVVVPGQPLWGAEAQLEQQLGGASESARGYVLFRKVDLDGKGVTLQVNDRILKMGHLDTEVYITRLQPRAHYPDQNGSSLVRAWFSDRLPAKQRGS